ncbi:MAG: DUF945 family protein [Mariprofundaceae bacterium]|nr:DUF945 family protein [Mariprofundaceae bacterium]
MKKTLIITLCLCAVLAMAPLGTGFLAQKNYTELIESQSMAQLTLSNVDYNRGWLQSTINTQVDIQDPEVLRYYQDLFNTTKPLQVNIEHQVQHGPLLFTEEGICFGFVASHDTVTFTKTSAPELNALTANNAPAIAFSTFKFNGEYKTSIQIAAIQHQKDGEKLSIEPISIELTAQDTIETMQGSVEIPKVTFQINEQGSLNVADLKLQLKLWQENNTPLGQWELSYASIKAFKGDEILFDSQETSSQVSIQAQSTKPELLDFSYEVHMKKLQIEENSYESGHLQLDITNIPAQAFNTLSTNTSQQDAVQNIPKLLSEGLLLKINAFNFTTPHGEVVGKLNAQLPKLSAQQVEDLSYLRANTTVSFDLSAPRDFVDGTSFVAQVPLLLMMGIVKEQDNIYSIKANLQDNKLQVNGKEMPF